MTKRPKCLFLLIFPGRGFARSFVFLTFSEPARVLSSPISLSETGHPKGSEFACLLRKAKQSNRGWKYSGDISVHRAVISKCPLALLWHMRGCTWACKPDVPINSKSSSSISCSQEATPRHQTTPVLLCHLPGALKPTQHCRLQAQLSGAGETKHHLLCKHLFQACLTWLSASSLHFITE